LFVLFVEYIMLYCNVLSCHEGVLNILQNTAARRRHYKSVDLSARFDREPTIFLALHTLFKCTCHCVEIA